MDNPFRPTFGAPPLFWVGRGVVLDSFRTALDGSAGNASRSMVLSGARGIGKTVLINELEDIAEARGWVTLRASGRSTMVEELVNTTIPRLLERLSPSDKKKVSRIGIGGVGSIGFDHQNEDRFTPTLNTRLRELSSKLKGTGILLTIDEVQDADVEDLTTIAVAYQDLVRDEIDIALVAAGLPQGVNHLLDLPGVTFLRRAQKFVLGPLSPANAEQALEHTASGSGLEFSREAITDAVALTRGYPYLVQLVGSLAWERSRRNQEGGISQQTIASIAPDAISIMGAQVHQPATLALPPAQREFLEAMAAVEVEGIAPIADIAGHMDRTVRSLSATRQRLIDADLIEPTAHGKLRYVIPYMGEYFTTTDSRGRVD